MDLTDLSKLRWIPAERAWRFSSPDQIDVDIGGDEEGPYPPQLELAKLVIAGMGQIARDAKEYLRHFIAFERLDCKGEWELVSVEIGLTAEWRPGEIDVLLALDNDLYGFWTVQMRDHLSHLRRFWPCAFSRVER